MPTFGHLARVLDEHGSRPGVDRLTAGRMAVVNFLIGNADAHGKNIAFLHEDDGRIRLAPLYDLVSTAAWPHLDRHLAMPIADELDPTGSRTSPSTISRSTLASPSTRSRVIARVSSCDCVPRPPT